MTNMFKTMITIYKSENEFIFDIFYLLGRGDDWYFSLSLFFLSFSLSLTLHCMVKDDKFILGEEEAKLFFSVPND